MKNLNIVLTEVARNGMVRFPILETQSLRSIPVSDLNLDTRSSNAIQRNHIQTIGELLDNIGMLKDIRGLGAKSKSNILYSLCAFQYNLLNEERKKEYLNKIVKMNTERR